MSKTRDFCWLVAWTALAVGACGCRGSSGAPAQSTRALLWREAWGCAAAVSSPIDAGRTRIALAAMAVEAGQAGQIERAIDADTEDWVKGAEWAAVAASAALDGDVSQAERAMQKAQAFEKRSDEWRVPLMAPEMRKGGAALVLMTKADRRPDLAALQEWTESAPAERTIAAAWVCAEWVRRHGDPAKSRQPEIAVRAALGYAAKLYPWDRLAILVRVAPQMRKLGMTDAATTTLDQLFNAAGPSSLSTNHFESAVAAARVWAALGDTGQALRLIRTAEINLGTRRVGEDVFAPWVLLANAQADAGQTPAAIKQMLTQGLTQAAEQRGFYRTIAAALTVGGMAVSPCEWTNEDVARICSSADALAQIHK